MYNPIIRHRNKSGERNGRAKLTSAQVNEIRQLAGNGGILQWELAEKFGVTPAVISRILYGRSWKQ